MDAERGPQQQPAPTGLTGVAQAEAAPPGTKQLTATGRSLDRSLLLGVAWTAGVKWLAQILSWTSTFILARILSPNDYGLFGMAQVFMSLLGPIYDFGAGATVIQRRDYNARQVAEVGGIGLLFGVLLFGLTLLAARPIGGFFHEPGVVPIILLVGVFQLIRSLQVLPRSLLARDLEFRQLALLDGMSQIIATISMFTLALLGAGVWTLPMGPIFAAIVTTPIALRMRPHRVAWPRDRQTLRETITFGRQVIGARIGRYLYGDSDFLIVGRVLGKTALGLYTIGWTIATIPVERISELLTQVAPSVFSAVQNDKRELRRYFLAISQGLAILTLPASVGLALTANDFVIVVLGEKWRMGIVPLQILSLYAAFRSLTTVTAPVLVATGNARSDMRFTLLATAVLPISFYIGTRWGTTGVAMAWAIVFPIVALPLFRLVFRILEVRTIDYLRALEPAIVGTAIMSAAVLLVQSLTRGLPGAAALALEAGTGVAVYFAVMRLRYWDRLTAFVRLVRRRDG